MANSGQTPRKRRSADSSSASHPPSTSARSSSSRSISGVRGAASSSPRSQPAEFPDRPSPSSVPRSSSPASAGSESFHSDSPSRSSTHSSRFPLAWAAGASSSSGGGGGGSGVGAATAGPRTVPLTSDPSTFTSPTSASASSASTTPSNGTANPSAPVTVNTPLPVMHLPGALSSASRRSQAAASSPRTAPASATSAPDPSAFNFSALLSDLLRDPHANKDLDAMAKICGRSKLSRANEYAAHREPVGAGGGGGGAGHAHAAAPAESTGAIHIAGSDHGESSLYYAEDGDGSLHSTLMTHFAPFIHSSGAALDTVEEAASEHSRATSFREERRRSALDVFSGSSDRTRQRRSPARGSPGRMAAPATASIAASEGMGTGVVVPPSTESDHRPGRARHHQSLPARREAEGRLRWLAGT